ncbi:MAG: CRISPR-associated protein [Tissierellia bacterium]|nr:CRISPR-associated protein [Tissierellia bacterium]
MFHEIILENKVKKEDYYFKSKIYKRKGKKPSDFINDYKYNKYIESEDIKQIQKISGIFNTPEDIDEYVKNLLPGSFGIWCEFELESPYFSKDDDNLYIIQNPIIKEMISKIPMVKGSSWKGFLSSVALNKLRENVESKDIPSIISCYLSFVRIFGTGSETFRELEREIKKAIGEAERKNSTKLTETLFQYCVFDLGININIKKDGTSINKQLIDEIIKKQNEQKVKNIFSVNKGRAIFYPTYFNKINYEVINPHDREKRVGINPIFYEVVPKGAIGIFQLIYIPHNGILLEENVLKSEMESDKEFIEKILKEALENVGIGAKTKLGWGRGKIKENDIKYFESNVGGVK